MVEPQNSSIKVTDRAAIAIVEHYQRQVGDSQSAKTLTRMIQAFYARGMNLAPTPNGQATDELHTVASNRS